MRYPELKIAANHNNQAGLVSVETLVTYPPHADLVPMGSVARRMMSDRLRRDGERDITWRWGFMLWDDLDNLITTIVGSWDTASKQVTIRTLKRNITYGNFNATLWTPVPRTEDATNADYTQETLTKVSDLRIRFIGLVEI